MGDYIETPKDWDKVEQIIELYGAKWTPVPNSWEDIPEGKALIIVVNNGHFDAALFVSTRREYARCVPERRGDLRHRTFLLMDRAKAEELTGWKPEKEER